MVCRVLFFDYREAEKSFFDQNKFPDFDIRFFKWSLTEESVNKLSEEDLDKAMIISVFTTSHITEKVLSKFNNLRIISTRSTGYNHIESTHCIDKNIALINVESYGNSSVAQFTFALIFMLIRKILPAVESVKKGIPISDFTGHSIESMSIGIIGTGSIGAVVCRMANSFGMKILAYDLSPKRELKNKYNVEYVELDTLLQHSDIISLHIPYCKQNHHFIGAKQFKLMKQGAYFINVSRGELVDIKELLKSVKTKKIKGVALDMIYCVESACLDEENDLENSSLKCSENAEIVRELNKLANVIITPHIAYDTQDSINYILKTTFIGLKDCLYGGKGHRVF